MVEYNTVNVKLPDTQLKELSNVVKNKIGTTLRKIHGSGNTTLIISNEEMNDITKIIQALENSTILIKGVTKAIKNETKEQKRGFLSMLLGTLGASLLGNLLTGKQIVRAGSGNKKGKGILRAGSGRPLSPTSKNEKGKVILRASLGKEFLIFYKYYKNEPRFNVFFLEIIYLKKHRMGLI